MLLARITSCSGLEMIILSVAAFLFTLGISASHSAESDNHKFDRNEMLRYLNEYEWKDEKKRSFTKLTDCTRSSDGYGPTENIEYRCRGAYVKVSSPIGKQFCELQSSGYNYAVSLSVLKYHKELYIRQVGGDFSGVKKWYRVKSLSLNTSNSNCRPLNFFEGMNF